MQQEPQARSRDVLPIVTASALVMLAWLSFDSDAARNREIQRVIETDMHAQLTEHVHNWEQNLQNQLDEIVSFSVDAMSRPTVPADTKIRDLHKLEKRYQRRYSWLDGVYLWQSPDISDPMSDGRAQMLYPPPPPRQPLAGSDCILEGRQLTEDKVQDARRVAGVYIRSCADQSRAVRAYAVSEAALVLRNADLHDEALELLRNDDLDDTTPFANQLLGHPVPLPVRVNRRMLLAELLRLTGEDTAADKLLKQTVYDVTDLDTARLELVLYAARSAIDRLQSHGVNVSSLLRRFHDAERRLEGFRDLVEDASRATPRYATEGARFVQRSFDAAPHILYLRPPDGLAPGVALHLKPPRLVRDFIFQQVARFEDSVIVSDNTGRTIVGSVDAVPSEKTSVPFQALPNMEVAFSEQAIISRVRPIQGRSLNWRNLVTLLSIVLGFGALYSFTRANRRHQELLRRQRQFTQRVTHELKTPLAGIKVMAEMLSMGAFKDAVQRADMADRIVGEADRLTQRVNEILDFARKRTLNTTEPYDIEEPVMQCIEAWGPRYEQRGVQLHADLAPVDELFGDPKAVRDAVGCLLDNALKYRRMDGSPKVWVTVREAGNWVEVEVLDNGLGVPLEDRRSIFERFKRVEGDNRGMAGGHGLGLAQVAEIVAIHKGTVTCEDGVDGGSRFVIRLPARS